MALVTISAPRHEQRGGVDELAATVTIEGRAWELWFRTAAGPIATGPEPFVSLALLAAMRVGGTIRVESPVSPRLLEGLTEIQAAFSAWDASLSIVPIEATPQDAASGDGAGPKVASMFSGGVDSFFTLFENLEAIDDLIFVHGFDIPLDRRWLRRRSARLLAEAAATVQKRLVHVATNVRPFADRFASWGRHMHGPAIAAVAHILSPNYHTVIVPGERLREPDGRLLAAPPGSNEITNPLWGTERLALVHHGQEHMRLQKVEAIGGYEPVRRSLRVCYENYRGAYNCGECPKCLWNMALLHLAGNLDHIRTFDQPLQLDLLARMPRFRRQGLLRRRRYWMPRATVQEVLTRVERTGAEAQLARALQDCLNEVHYRGGRYVMRRILGRSRRIARAVAP